MTETMKGKEKILESSLLEFANYGFEGARVDRISKDAGVNKALIYYYFSNKKELYIAAINRLFEKAAPKQMQFPGDMTVRQKMQYMIRHFIYFLHDNPLFVKIMDQAVYMDRDIFENLYEQNHFFEMSLALYEEGVANGEIRKVDHPADYLVSLLGACYFYFSHRNAVRKFYDEQLAENQLVELRIRTLEDIADRVFFVPSS